MSDIVYCPPNVDCPCYAKLTDEIERLGRDYQTARDAHDNLFAEVERLRVERDEQVQWVKDLADDLIKAEAEIERLRAALEWIVGTSLTEPEAMVARARAALRARDE